LTVPDPRGNGELLPVYNLNPAKLGLLNELDDNSAMNTRVYRGVDVSFNLRLSNGGSIFGGTSTGHVVTGTCEVDDPNTLRFCDQGDYAIPLAILLQAGGQLPDAVGHPGRRQPAEHSRNGSRHHLQPAERQPGDERHEHVGSGTRPGQCDPRAAAGSTGLTVLF
jgi:hypothetical protein